MTSMTTHIFFRCAAAAIVIALSFCTRSAIAEGDADQGEVLGFTCIGCHGIDGQRNAYPSFRVPKLGGQNSEYLRASLKAYRAGSRPHPTMQAQAGAMSDGDIDNLVAWLATFGSVDDGATAAEVAGVEAAEICVTCHGVQGQNVQSPPPTLAGQHADYLVHALNQYKNGVRSGNVMSAFAAGLSDADIDMLADFYSRQDGLETLEARID